MMLKGTLEGCGVGLHELFIITPQHFLLLVVFCCFSSDQCINVDGRLALTRVGCGTCPMLHNTKNECVNYIHGSARTIQRREMRPVARSHLLRIYPCVFQQRLVPAQCAQVLGASPPGAQRLDVQFLRCLLSLEQHRSMNPLTGQQAASPIQRLALGRYLGRSSSSFFWEVILCTLVQ